jgi:hypothetical protein
VDAATVIQADAVEHGAGGKVVVWADDATRFDGQITARGLGSGQAGGQVETSGKLTLGVGQTARVDASSPQGTIGNWLLDPTNLTISAGGAGTIGGAGDQEVDASVINTAAATVTLTATENITFNQSIAMTKAGAGLTATAGGNLVVNGVTIATNNGEINFTADSDKNGSGFLTLSVGSKLTTKGAGVNLTVDHGSATSTDGIKIFGDIDTRTSATGFGKLSTFQLKGSAQTGVLEVGAVTLNGGDDRGTPIVFSHGDFDLYADEINLTGGAKSVKGTGHLNLRPASLTTNVKFSPPMTILRGNWTSLRRTWMRLAVSSPGWVSAGPMERGASVTRAPSLWATRVGRLWRWTAAKAARARSALNPVSTA